jgi:diacylglycerol kinase (CTP)
MKQNVEASRSLHVRSDLHLARKLWHMVMGVMIAAVYFAGLPMSASIVILSSVLALAVLVETARLHIPAVNEKVVKFWAPVMRSHETHRMSTVPQYLLASILAIAIFPKAVAILAILYLACGDPAASLFGIRYGHLGLRFSNGKSLIGTAAGILVCFLVSLAFLSLAGIVVEPSTLLIVSLIGGIAGGTAEMLPFDVDDNFTIPVASGFVLWLAFIALGL